MTYQSWLKYHKAWCALKKVQDQNIIDRHCRVNRVVLK